MASSFNFFANIDEFANCDDNNSFGDIESSPTIVDVGNISDIVDTQPKFKTKGRPKRNAIPMNDDDAPKSKKKSTNDGVVLKLDDDEADVSEVVPVAVPGYGQKTAFKKLNTLKKSLQSATKISPKRSAASSSAAILSVAYQQQQQRRTRKRNIAAASSNLLRFDSVVDEVIMPIDVKPRSNRIDEFDDDENNISLKLKWEGTSKVEKIQFRMHKKFNELIRELSNRENIDTKFFFLMLEHRVIKESDSPHSIGYTIGKFISVRVIENNPTLMISKSKLTQENNSIELKIQSLQWKKPMVLSINKTDPFKVLTVMCAEELKCPSEKLRFTFDGDILEMSSTPTDLEFDGGEILDLIISK